MSHSIKLTPQARTDIQEIMAYYENEKIGLSIRFFNTMSATLKLVASNPMLFQVRYKNSRAVLIKKFPIQIHYLIDEQLNQVVIFAATHTSANPQIWKNRT